MRAAVLTLVTLTALSGGPLRAQQVGPSKDMFLLTDKEAVGVLPPELAASGGVEWAKWSFDGRYVLIHRNNVRFTPELLKRLLSRTLNTPPGETTITVWDSKTHESRDVWKRPAGAASVERIEWLPGSPSALALVRTMGPPKTPTDPPRPPRGQLPVHAGTGNPKDVVDQTGALQ